MYSGCRDRRASHLRLRFPAVAPARSAASSAAPLFSSSSRDASATNRAGMAASGNAGAGRGGGLRRKTLRAIASSGRHNNNSAAAAMRGAPIGPTSGRTKTHSAVTTQPTDAAPKTVARATHHAATVIRRAATATPPADMVSAKAVAVPLIKASIARSESQCESHRLPANPRAKANNRLMTGCSSTCRPSAFMERSPCAAKLP